jgi:hypothetical protein
MSDAPEGNGKKQNKNKKKIKKILTKQFPKGIQNPGPNSSRELFVCYTQQHSRRLPSKKRVAVKSVPV